MSRVALFPPFRRSVVRVKPSTIAGTDEFQPLGGRSKPNRKRLCDADSAGPHPCWFGSAGLALHAEPIPADSLLADILSDVRENDPAIQAARLRWEALRENARMYPDIAVAIQLPRDIERFNAAVKDGRVRAVCSAPLTDSQVFSGVGPLCSQSQTDGGLGS